MVVRYRFLMRRWHGRQLTRRWCRPATYARSLCLRLRSGPVPAPPGVGAAPHARSTHHDGRRHIASRWAAYRVIEQQDSDERLDGVYFTCSNSKMGRADRSKYKELVNLLAAELAPLAADLSVEPASLGADHSDGEPAMERPERELRGGLTDRQRNLLGKVLSDTFRWGVVCTLSTLEDLRLNERLSIQLDGVQIPVRPFGELLEDDWSDRNDGVTWQDECECPVHRCSLAVGTAQIRYGLFRPYSREFYEAQEQLFPNAHYVELGGCIVGKEKTRNIVFCPDCREAHVEWCKKTGVDFGLPRSTNEP